MYVEVYTVRTFMFVNGVCLLQMKDKVKELELKLVSAEAEKETLNKVM